MDTTTIGIIVQVVVVVIQIVGYVYLPKINFSQQDNSVITEHKEDVKTRETVIISGVETKEMVDEQLELFHKEYPDYEIESFTYDEVEHRVIIIQVLKKGEDN